MWPIDCRLCEGVKSPSHDIKSSCVSSDRSLQDAVPGSRNGLQSIYVAIGHLCAGESLIMIVPSSEYKFANGWDDMEPLFQAWIDVLSACCVAIPRAGSFRYNEPGLSALLCAASWRANVPA